MVMATVGNQCGSLVALVVTGGDVGGVGQVAGGRSQPQVKEQKW